MTRITEVCLKQKNSFLPNYGHNKSQKNGRRMEKNPPTFASMLDHVEKIETKKNRFHSNRSLNSMSCGFQFGHLIQCLTANGKDGLTKCAAEFENVKDCYETLYADKNIAAKIYNTQVDLILKKTNLIN